MHDKALHWLLLGALILAIGAVHVVALRPGHGWGGDFAQYVHHAKNLVEGVPYADTGYVYNPDYPQVGPPAYPPGTALLLGPVYWASGLDLEAMKWAMIACFLVFLSAVFWCFCDELGPGPAAALVAVLGLHHWFLAETNQVRSDVPFLALLYLAILLVRRGEAAARAPAGKGDESHLCEAPSGPLRGKWDSSPFPAGATRYYLAAGVAAYLAYATRTVGALLIPAVVLADLVRARRITRPGKGDRYDLPERPGGCFAQMVPVPFSRPVILACAVFGCLAMAQAAMFPGQAAYFDQLHLSISAMARNVWSYGTQMAVFWHNGYSKPLAVALLAAVTLLALLGYAESVRRRFGACEVFVVIYLAAIFVWPTYQGTRFLYPILPLYLFYALKGLESCRVGQAQRRPTGEHAGPGGGPALRLSHPTGLARREKLHRATAASLAVAVAISYAAMATTMESGPLPEGVAKPESVAMFEYVRDHAGPDDVVVFVKPRVMSLFAGRDSSVYHQPEDKQELWAYFDRIGARWVVVVENDAAFAGSERPEVLAWLRRFARRNESRLARAWENADFTVYRIL